MASEVSISEGETEDWEDEEDWTSTDWADPNGAKTTTNPLSNQNTNAHTTFKTSHSAQSASSDVLPKSDDSAVVRRMLLNDNKAGMEGLDKDRINQIIHEASKGSKFYENERQKEEQMKRRIEEQRQKIQQISAEQLRQGTAEADRLLEDFEQQRDLSRTIVHIDMDAFYAAVEMRDDPSLKNKPMAVGGNSMLSTSNYHARKFGVRAAMPGFIGRKLCPDLVIVPLNFDKYTSVSKQVKSVMAEYDPNFCPMSLDEAYLDLTEHLEKRQLMLEEERTFICRDSSYADSRAHCKCDLNEISRNYTASKDGTDLACFFSKSDYSYSEEDNVNDTDLQQTNNAVKARRPVICPKCHKELPPFQFVTFGCSDEEAVKELRARIEQKTTLTASAGIAPNMMLAKVCSDKNKPNGQYKIQASREDVMNFIKDLPTRKISGIGKVSEAMLNAVGVYTCTDLYEKRGLLYHLYSQISFNYFMRICLGIGSTTVERDSERKSMSTERTFSEINRPADLFQKCEELCQSLSEDLKSEQLKGKTISIKIKTVKFDVRTRAHTVPDYTNDYEDILRSATELLKTEIQNCLPQPLRLRLMGVRMSNLLNESLCHRKKQNTIIGAFKRLAQPAASMESPEKEITVKDVNVSTSNEASYHVRQVSCTDTVKDSDISDAQYHSKDIKEMTGLIKAIETTSDTTKNITEDSVNETDGIGFTEETRTALDKAKDKTKELVNENDLIGQSNWRTASEVLNNLSELPLREEKANVDRLCESENVDKAKDVLNKSLPNSEETTQTNTVCNEEGNSENIEDRNLEKNIRDKNIDVNDFVCKGKEENEKQMKINNGVSLETEVSLYSPNVRKTRSGFIRTPVSQAKGRKRKGRNKENTSVTYVCPVCALNILCENLQSFNEHVDKCLESEPNGNDSSIENNKLHDGEQKEETEKALECDTDKNVDTVSETSKALPGKTNFKEKFKKICSEAAVRIVGNNSTKSKTEDEEALQIMENNKTGKESEFDKGQTQFATSCLTHDTENFVMNRINERNTENDYGSYISTNEREITNRYDDIKEDTDIENTVPDTNREKHVSHVVNDNEMVVDKDAETKPEQDFEITEININTFENGTQKNQEISDIAGNEFVEEGVNKDKCLDIQVASPKDREVSTDIGIVKELHVDALVQNAVKDTENDDAENEKLENTLPLPMIPFSPKIIVTNAGRTNADVTNSESGNIYEAITNDAKNIQHTMEQNFPGCSDTTEMEHFQGRGIEHSKRTTHTTFWDEIEVLNDDDKTEDTAGSDTDETEGTLLVCPICNVEQRSADLNEFNSHVDACLSRGAISEILREEKKKDSGTLKRSRPAVTPGSAKSAKRRKTAMPNITKPCRSIASFFQEK